MTTRAMKHRHTTQSERTIPGSCVRGIYSQTNWQTGTLLAARIAVRKTCSCGATRDVVIGVLTKWVTPDDPRTIQSDIKEGRY